jgi:aquaporin related protein
MLQKGAAILQAITPGMLNARTTLGGGTSVAQGLFIEMFLTSLYAFSFCFSFFR